MKSKLKVFELVKEFPILIVFGHFIIVKFHIIVRMEQIDQNNAQVIGTFRESFNWEKQSVTALGFLKIAMALFQKTRAILSINKIPN